MTKLHEVRESGQSVWCDFIRRLFVASGGLALWIDRGVSGVSSNPSIFEKAIAASQDYDGDLKALSGQSLSVDRVYENLVVADVRMAADILSAVYQKSGGADGFVTLGMDPGVFQDKDKMVSEATRLFTAVGRKNLMIKVPATGPGLSAMRDLVAAGINVNAALGFSSRACLAAAAAVLDGLSGLSQKGPTAPGGLPAERLGTLVSVYVGKMDDWLNAALAGAGAETGGMRPGVAMARVIHDDFENLLSERPAADLAGRGARLPRVMFASMGVNNPTLPETHYAENLVLPRTVSTLPPRTLAAFLEEGGVPAGGADLGEARERVRRMGKAVDLEAAMDALQRRTLADYVTIHRRLRRNIEQRRGLIVSAKKTWNEHLGPVEKETQKALERLKKDNVLARIWEMDHTVWKPDPEEIRNRLGWMFAPETMAEAGAGLAAFARELKEEGFTHALLLGMGGSSLAPELFAKTFSPPVLDLAVLDSTDPDCVRAMTARSDPAKTLYIVSSKSGGTTETLSFMKYCYNLVVDALGEKEAGRRFAAVTDPGSGLFAAAEKLGFRKVFLNDPNVGGRYSALTYFGLAPAALSGVDCERLLRRAQAAAANAHPCNCPVDGDNSAARLGAAMAAAAAAGRDKLTIVTSPSIAAFGPWAEQLVAESTGKEGKGVFPVSGEPVAAPEGYGDDRLFVYLRMVGEHARDAEVAALEKAGHPVIRLHLRDLYDLGGEFFRWEMATAIAGHLLGINPFDQPNVESAKKAAKEMVAAYREKGSLPEREPAAMDGPIRVYADESVSGIRGALQSLFSRLREKPPRSYLAVCAFLAPSQEVDSALAALRREAAKKYRIAATAEYGPRFLHSTGQLHKGDAGNGLFIQLMADHQKDLPIPDEAGKPGSSLSFGVLLRAQAMGDEKALRDAGRPVVGFHLGENPAEGIRRLIRELP
ncbi:MAG: bifunctional transaldolase/phosoglucose isomerase [Deltaproteobacteria bacterium]|nr:bifunctional transaldolase/phosoglucose isomerase [Deltaproteobacteria bacterium]